MKYLSLTIPGTNGTPIKIDSGLPVPTGGLFGTGQNIIFTFLNLALVIAILVALYSIGQGGLNMIASEGEKEKLKKGREQVTFAVLGLIFIFLSFFAINIISTFFGFNLSKSSFLFK